MVRFANRYVHSGTLRRRIALQMARRGIAPAGRRRIKRGVYDWQKDHARPPAWCSRSEFNRKACAAAFACIATAGATLANEADHPWRQAAINCAAAAATVWFAP